MIRIITAVLSVLMLTTSVYSQIPMSQPTFKKDTTTEEGEIKAFIKSYDAAWNSHQPEQLGALWINEGDLITPWGRWVMGQDQVIKYLDILKSKFYEKSVMTQSVDLTRVITREIGIVDTTVRITNVVSPYLDKDEPLILHGIYVLAKLDDKWKIVSARFSMFQNRPIE